MASPYPGDPAQLRPRASPPPDDLISDVNDRELRLTALINVLGFPSLDDLEDFVFLHGAAKVVPAAQRDTLPLDDTQTQYSETRHARRNQERKIENAQLYRDLARVNQELEWTRAEVAKERCEHAALVKDKQRLLDLVEELRQPGAQPSPAFTSCSAGSLSSQAVPVELELSRCLADIASLEMTVAALEDDLRLAAEARDEYEAELRDLKQELKRVQQDKLHGDAAVAELAQIKERLFAVIPAMLGTDKPASASPTGNQALPSSSSRRPAASASSGLLRAPPTPRRASAGTALSPRPNRTSRSASATVPATVKPSPQIPALPRPVTSATDLVPVPTATATVPPQHPSATPVISTAVASTTSATPVLAQPRVVASGALTPASPRAPEPFASALPPEAATQASLYPQLHSTYTAHRTAVRAYQTSLPALSTRIDALPSASTAVWRAKHDAPPILAAAELKRFTPVAPLPTDADARDRMARCGSLGTAYRELEDKEKELGAIVKVMAAWEKSAKRLLARLDPAAGAGSAKKRPTLSLQDEPGVSGAATPTGQPVKKRRKVVKSAGATPATTAASTSRTAAPTAGAVTSQRVPPADVDAAPTPTPVLANRSPSKVRASTPTSSATGESPQTSGRKARWNLISPTKRNRISPHKLSGSGIKAQLWRADEHVTAAAARERCGVLVDDTQVIPAPGPALPRRVSSEADREPSTYEAEPDTIGTEGSSQQHRVRSSSHSPQKPTPRRALSVLPGPRRHAPPVQTTAADDPFVVRPLQPSPNARTAAARRAAAVPSASPSPASSPEKALEMPPSAQIGSRTIRRARGGDEDGEDVATDAAFTRELRFFGALGTPPLRDPTPSSSPSPSPSPKKKATKRERSRAAKGRGKARADDDVPIKVEEDVADAEMAFGLSPATKKRRRGSKTPKVEEGADAVEHGDNGHEHDPDDARYMTTPYPEYGKKAEQLAWLADMRRKRKAALAEDKAKEESCRSATKRKVEVNPERNKGESELFKETERRKKERQKMLAEPCQQCVEYYERAGKPVQCAHILQGPPAIKRHLDYRAEEQAERLQAAGRHRVPQRTEKEPPDYWQMGMPSSGRVEEINRRAKAQNEERRAYQETEAKSRNGVYRYRASEQ